MIRLGFLLVLVASLASAQEAGVEEIVVTGSRVDFAYDDMPAVTITKEADFLVQSIRLLNDSRSPDFVRRKSDCSRECEGQGSHEWGVRYCDLWT